MKKLLALCLTVILCLCCLASCGSAHKENEWFSEDKLTECLVGDLPTIEKDYVNHDDGDIYVSFTNKERESYVVSVFEYLKSQNFKYLGTRGEQASTLAGSFTTYYFKPATELSEFYVDSSYKFVYSDGTLDEGGDPIFCILTIYDYEAKNLEYGTKNFAYNTLITLRYKSEAPLSGRYALNEEEHEHTGEWHASESTHYYQYTCGCPSPDIAELHLDGDGDGLCDICSYQMLAEGNHFIRNQAGAEWLCEITAEDIAEIKMISGGGGPLPPVSFTYISSSKNDAVISSIFEEYYWLDSKPVPEESTRIFDGGYFIVQFILNNGETKQLYFIAHEFYHDGNGNYFEPIRLPVFRNGTNFVTRYGFERQYNPCQIHLMDETFVCEIPLSEFEFTELTDDIYLNNELPTHYLEMHGERVYFIKGEYFYIGDDRSVYYQLIKNLDELIAEYSVIEE